MTEVDADGGGSVKLAWARVRVSCKGKYMCMIWLRRKLGFSSDVRARVRLRLRVKMCLLLGINAQGEDSSPGLGPRVRVRCSVRFTVT